MIHYEVAIETIPSTSPDHEESYKAVAYLVTDDGERFPVYTKASCYDRHMAEQWEQELRDIYNTKGSQLKRVFVYRVMNRTEVIAERHDGGQHYLAANESNTVIEHWLKREGFVLVKPDPLLSNPDATRYKKYCPIAGDYERDILKHFQAIQARRKQVLADE